MNAVDKVLTIAAAEIGYLEKKTNNNLYDKTANAGTNNYTKYWADIAPEYQTQPWCSCFVTWVFVKAFGKEVAKKLLKHYPYISCWKISTLFAKNANPKRGDIVIFYRKGQFAHTGLVESVNGDYFTTIEGNTSGGSTIIANGGGVCRKGYYNSNLPGTKFLTPDYGLIEEESEMTDAEKKKLAELESTVSRLSAEVDALRVKCGYYNYIDGNMPISYRPTIQKLVGKKLLQGNERNELMLTTDMMRILTILDRTNVFDA